MTAPAHHRPEAARAAAFDLLYRSVGSSPTLRRVWRDAYGDEYPEEAEPLSYVTRSQLDHMARALAPARTLLDLGCGRGGPGLHVAAAIDARLLIGIDISPVAIAEASRRARVLGMEARCRYRLGTVAATGLPSASVEGALSVDVLQIAPAPRAALAEVARVLAPGARFAFTSWEANPPDGAVPPHVADRAVRDYGPELELAGFTVEELDRPADGLAAQLAVYRGILAHEPALRSELGAAFDVLAAEARDDPAWLERCRVRRVLAVARRRSGIGLVP